MSETIFEALSRVSVETFEQLAFMFGFPDDEVHPGAIEAPVYGQVRFSGPFSGVLVLRISSAVLPELAANMLGIDDEAAVTQEEKDDALKETINVICGNLLPAVAGAEPIFNMEPPRVTEADEAPKEGALTTAALSFDEGECTISIFVDGDVPEALFCVDVTSSTSSRDE